MLLNLGTNLSSKYFTPLLFVTALLVITATERGITTNKITDIISVFHGIVIPLIPSRSVTIGIKATRIIKSFIATATD